MYLSPNQFHAREQRDEDDKATVKYTAKGQDVEFLDSALGQFLTKVRIPAPFYRRCPPWLKVQNINHFNSTHKYDYLFRMEPTHEVRAALSDSYGIIDDKDLFPLLFNSLQDRTDVALRVFRHDSHITQLHIDFTDARGMHNEQEYVAGLVVTNSETGHSAVWIEPVVHTPTCSFVSRRLLKRQGVDCRIIHRGHFPEEKVAPLIDQAKEIAQVGVTQLAEAFQQRMPTERVITFARNMDNFPNRFVQILEEEWDNEERVVKAEAARRMILLAQELPLFQRIQVEQEAGTFIGLFDNYKSRFSDIMEEINNDI
jgi:hypothetical protein